MLRSILVGLDGSAYSHAAIALALRWTRQKGVLLAGIGIIDEPTIRGGEPVPLGARAYKHASEDIRLADARRRIEELLEWFSQQCAQCDVPFRAVESVGLPWEQIILEAQGYDLVLLGQQTYFHFETQEGPGDTLHEVLKHTPRPVVTVPETLREGSCVLVAYDGGVQAARTLQVFQSLELHRSEEVIVLSVHANQSEASRCGDRAVEFLEFHDTTAQSVAVASSKSPAEIILEQANRLNASLIVMGDIPPEIARPSGAKSAPASISSSQSKSATLDEVERQHVLRALESEQSNKSRAARMLGISRHRLYRLMEKHNLNQ